MDQPITYVGLDVHKDTIAVALAEMGNPGEVRVHGTIANTPAALKALAAKLACGARDLRFCNLTLFRAIPNSRKSADSQQIIPPGNLRINMCNRETI
jgi:hypothetical protein